jgi:hypothetical protein
MKELTRTNNLVMISWLQAALAGEGIQVFILDGHTSIVEGSISAIPRRVMVADDQLERARAVLAEAERLRDGDG